MREMTPLMLCLGLAMPAAAGELAYVEASTELHKGTPASYAYNAVDGKDTTTWCSSKGPSRERLVFGFEKSQRITEIGFIVGPVSGGKVDKKNARPKVVRLLDGQTQRNLELRDSDQMQAVKLDPPIKSSRLIVEVVEVRDGKKPDAPVCIAEVLLKDRRTELTGSSIGSKLRGLNTPSRRLLHTWIDNPDAPERTLTFSLDGSFKYSYEPLLEGKPRRITGKWSATGKYVRFTVHGKNSQMRYRLTKVDEGDGEFTVVNLSGDGPEESMISAFRVAPVQY